MTFEFAGSPVTVKLIAVVKAPFNGVTVTSYMAFCPAFTVAEPGVTAMEKSVTTSGFPVRDPLLPLKFPSPG